MKDEFISRVGLWGQRHYKLSEKEQSDSYQCNAVKRHA